MEGLQLSMFDILSDAQSEKDRLLEKAISRGSGFENGPLRIYAASKVMDQKRFSAFLREEFGVGGHSMDTDHGYGMCDYNHSGITIRIWKENRVFRYTWNTVADLYRRMIDTLRFPDEAVRKKVDDAAALPEPAPRMHYVVGGDDGC